MSKGKVEREVLEQVEVGEGRNCKQGPQSTRFYTILSHQPDLTLSTLLLMSYRPIACILLQPRTSNTKLEPGDSILVPHFGLFRHFWYNVDEPYSMASMVPYYNWHHPDYPHIWTFAVAECREEEKKAACLRLLTPPAKKKTERRQIRFAPGRIINFDSICVDGVILMISVRFN